MQNSYYKRLAKMEAAANAQKAELAETIQDAYERACAENDEEQAAEFARKLRNKLLEDSDNEMTLDRLGLSVPSGSTFTAWLSFLRGLGEKLCGAWATYRKELRDLPEQEGFPFNITFPTPPDSGNTEGSE